MKTYTKSACFLLLALVLFQCNNDDDVAPIKEREKEPIDTALETMEADKFSVVGVKSNVTDTGYDVEGDLYLDTDSGQVAILEEASFTVTMDAMGTLESIQGVGPVAFPELGMLGSFSLSESIEAAFVYNTGKYFKTTNPSFSELPLHDTRYYFFFNLINLVPGQSADISIKNADIGVTDFFLNVSHQEVIVSSGSFAINTPGGGSISMGTELAIGISGKGGFAFSPNEYADSALNATIEAQKAFSDINGFLYLQGEVSLKDKIPMKLAGTVVVSGAPDDIFTTGFGPSSFVLAMNGQLIFGHDLLDLLPVDFDTELTNVTLRAEQTAENGKVTKGGFKFAGEFDDNAWMETLIDGIVGHNVSKYVPLTGNEGAMFASFGDDMDDWALYVNAAFALNTPHLGKQELRNGSLLLSAKEIGIKGGLSLPFMPGEITATGNIDFDGNLHLKGEAKGDLKIKDIAINSHFNVEIRNDYASLKGNVNLPAGIGQMNVTGQIDQSGLSFSGEGDSREMTFKDGISLPARNLKLSVAINKTNPEISLALKILFTPLDALIDAHAKFDTRGVELSGLINSPVFFIDENNNSVVFPLVDMHFFAQTWQGVEFKGAIQLPFGLGKAKATGHLTARRDMHGFPEMKWVTEFSSDPTLNLEGFSVPTAGFDLVISTIEGAKFSSRLKFGKIAWVNVTGDISKDKIWFTGSFNGNVNFNGRVLSAELDFSGGNGRYPNIGSVSGSITTPFGTIDVFGVVGLNGNFALNGSSAFCKTFNFAGDRSVRGNLSFSFKQTGVGLSASGQLCKNGCGSSSDCIGAGLSVDADWANGSFKICVPIPPFGPTVCV